MYGRFMVLLILAVVSSCMVPNVENTRHPATQASALKNFLESHPDWRQLQEEDCDPDNLKQMRESFGEKFSPYYCEGDFNRDGRNDFAVILVNKAAPVEIKGLASSHRLQYKLKIVVFNGLPSGQYDAVFTEDDKGPFACFLRMSDERQSKLFFGVLETCSGFVVIPEKSGYRIEDLPDPE